jgi:hypothetical protein
MTDLNRASSGVEIYNRVPTATEIQRAHTNADVDTATTAMHHTLGILHNQSSPGDHNHNGKSSRKIGKGLDPAFPTTAGATYTQAQIQSIINALRALGLGT